MGYTVFLELQSGVWMTTLHKPLNKHQKFPLKSFRNNYLKLSSRVLVGPKEILVLFFLCCKHPMGSGAGAHYLPISLMETKGLQQKTEPSAVSSHKNIAHQISYKVKQINIFIIYQLLIFNNQEPNEIKFSFSSQSVRKKL